MNFLSVRKIAGLFAVLVALAIGVPGFAQTGGVVGKATQRDGSVCVKCQIILERQEIHGVYKTKTNKKGEYIYIGLPLGVYKISLQDPDGKPLFYVTQKLGLGDPTEVDFDLPKLMATQKEEEQREAKANPELAKQLAAQQQAQTEAKKSEKEFTGLKEFYDQGNTLYGQQNYKAAAAAYEKALPFAKGKNLPVVLGRLADAYQKANENQQALETYQKAIQLTPDDANLHNNLGTVYAAMGKFTEAQAEFQKAAQLDPAGASRYYFNVGAIMYNAGKMDEAADAFKKVIQGDPKNAQAYYLEGQALMGKVTMTPEGKVVAPEGTVEAFETYLKLEPNGPNAAAARQMIATLKGVVPTQYKKK
jgi:tetratricopeptide (TPR) repeat protein